MYNSSYRKTNVFENSMFKYVSAMGGTITIIIITIITTVRLVDRGVWKRVFPTLQALPFRDRS